MLTQEQTRLRIRDSEIRELRKENEALKERINGIKKVVKDSILLLAEKLPYSYRAKIIEMANEMEV